MNLTLAKWFHKFMLRHDQRRRERLLENWCYEKEALDRAHRWELDLIDGAISEHSGKLLEISNEELWINAARRSR
jgi:hypothetical protein